MKTERTTLNGCFHCTHVKGKGGEEEEEEEGPEARRKQE